MTSHIFWTFLTYLPTLSYSITSDFGGYLGPPYLSWYRTSLIDVLFVTFNLNVSSHNIVEQTEAVFFKNFSEYKCNRNFTHKNSRLYLLSRFGFAWKKCKWRDQPEVLDRGHYSAQSILKVCHDEFATTVFCSHIQSFVELESVIVATDPYFEHIVSLTYFLWGNDLWC